MGILYRVNTGTIIQFNIGNYLKHSNLSFILILPGFLSVQCTLRRR